MCTARGCWRGGVLPEGGQGAGRGHEVRSQLYAIPGNLTHLERRYLVYNLRKRGGDTADKYFTSTELIAGVKDMRFQALMPDVLHWLGIKKIDNMVSMSDMKYDAIVRSGITIDKRYDIPGAPLPFVSSVGSLG